MVTKHLVGTIADTDGTGVNCFLTIKLNAPLIDASVTPDKVYYPKPDTFELTAGSLAVGVKQDGVAVPSGINLQANDEVTYNFSCIYYTETLILYLNGVEYFGYFHKWSTDNQYYTGEIHTVASQLLTPFTRKTAVSLFDPFDAHVLTTAAADLEWSTLQPSSVNYSNIDTSLFYIAQLITQTSALLQSLVAGIYNPRGNYSNATVYAKGDVVYDPASKGSFWYIFPTPASGIALSNTTYWQVLITSTEVTGGSVDFSPVRLNTAYAPSWNGNVTQCPTADVLYDKIQTLAELADANFASLKAPTKALGTNTTDVATMAALQAALAAYNPPSPTIAPDIPLGDVSNKIINSRMLKRMISRFAVAEERQPQGSNGGVIVGGFKNRNMNTLVINRESTAVGITGGYLQLDAGKYWVEGWSNVCGVDRNRTILIDSSGNFLLLGSSEETGNRGYQLQYRGTNQSTVKGYLELASTTNITIRHYAETTGNAVDSGKPANFAAAEVFAQLTVWKIE